MSDPVDTYYVKRTEIAIERTVTDHLDALAKTIALKVINDLTPEFEEVFIRRVVDTVMEAIEQTYDIRETVGEHVRKLDLENRLKIIYEENEPNRFNK